MVTPINYVQIQGFMVSNLKLKGNSLLVYALIYGFSQDGQSKFYGSRKYISEWFNISEPTVDKALQELIKKDLIIKEVETINNVNFNRYKINLEVLKIFEGGSKETLGGTKETLVGGTKETLYNNNIIDNDLNNNKDNLKKERKKETSYDEIINSYDLTDEIKELIYEFVKMRKMKKKPLTDRALKIQINKLLKISTKPNIQKEVIEKTITKCWDEFYPITEYATQKSTGNQFKDYLQKEYGGI